MKKIIYLLILISQLAMAAWAQEPFMVRDIQFEGLERISPATVESYLTIKRGQILRPAKTPGILRALYKTGFFEHIRLSREGNILIIHVSERPTIGQLKITGNSVIPTDKLTNVMKTLDIAEGRVYNPAILDRITQSLLNQYYALGRYNARVEVNVSPMPRNRVSVQINISEGLIAKIRSISIIGNHAFSERTLIKHLDVNTSGLFSFITQADRYSEVKLESSIEKLRNFYLDNGYIQFRIISSQAEVTPDRKSVYIAIVIKEGEPYTVKNFEVVGEKLPFPREEFVKRVTIQPGETFSRQKIIDSEKAITEFLGNNGYMFASISLRPRVNDKTHEVVVIFDIQPGKRAYVRHVSFTDNMRTNDAVLRREVTQLEAAPVSTLQLEDSKHRLSLLPYLKDVDMSMKPVPDIDDQVDVDFRVKEDNSAQASFKVGYSGAYGMMLGAGLNQKNFFGTGNTLGINLNRSQYEQFFGVDYTNPYFTEDGISQSLSMSFSRVNPESVSKLNNGYRTNEYDLGVLYGIPVGQEQGVFSRIMAGASYQNTLILLNKDPRYVSNQINDFIARHGRRFQELDLKLGYARDSRDRAIFPTKGGMQSMFVDVFAPLGHGSLFFYNLNYHGKWYTPLYNQFILLTRTDLGYGNGVHGIEDYPFYRNFYAGGIDTVRGFEDFSLGPRDSNGQAFGGNMLFAGSIGLIFPNFISDNLRTSVFVDAGNVYTSLNNRAFGGASTTSGPLRYSTGLEADLLTPLGPIQLSLAKGFAANKHDDLKIFTFALGANF